MRSLALGTVLILLSGPVFALSCIANTVPDTYKRADASEARYMAVHGTVTFDNALLPVVDWEDQMGTPPDNFIPARFTGKALSKRGFKHNFDEDILLNVQCIGPWCAYAESGQSFLGFVEKSDAGYSLTIGACGGDGFARPTMEMLDQAVSCMRGNSCISSNY